MSNTKIIESEEKVTGPLKETWMQEHRGILDIPIFHYVPLIQRNQNFLMVTFFVKEFSMAFKIVGERSYQLIFGQRITSTIRILVELS